MITRQYMIILALQQLREPDMLAEGSVILSLYSRLFSEGVGVQVIHRLCPFEELAENLISFSTPLILNIVKRVVNTSFWTRWLFL